VKKNGSLKISQEGPYVGFYRFRWFSEALIRVHCFCRTLYASKFKKAIYSLSVSSTSSYKMDQLQFILLDASPIVVEEWKRAFSQHVPDVIDRFLIIQSRLEDLSGPHQQFDCIVSPANSYGRLDGS